MQYNIEHVTEGCREYVKYVWPKLYRKVNGLMLPLICNVWMLPGHLDLAVQSLLVALNNTYTRVKNISMHASVCMHGKLQTIDLKLMKFQISNIGWNFACEKIISNPFTIDNVFEIRTVTDCCKMKKLVTRFRAFLMTR